MGDITRVLSADAGQDVATPTDFIFVKSATGAIEIITDGETIGMSQGDKHRFPKTVTRWRVKDASGSSNSVTLQIGKGDFARSEVSGSVTVAAGNQVTPIAKVSVTATTAVKLCDLDNDRVNIRVGVESTEAGAVYIGIDNTIDDSKGAIVEPGGIENFDTTAELWAYNPGGTAVVVNLLSFEKV